MVDLGWRGEGADAHLRLSAERYAEVRQVWRRAGEERVLLDALMRELCPAAGLRLIGDGWSALRPLTDLSKEAAIAGKIGKNLIRYGVRTPSESYTEAVEAFTSMLATRGFHEQDSHNSWGTDEIWQLSVVFEHADGRSFTVRFHTDESFDLSPRIWTHLADRSHTAIAQEYRRAGVVIPAQVRDTDEPRSGVTPYSARRARVRRRSHLAPSTR